MLAHEMTWEEYRDEVSKRVIILPAGSTEQHGPHLPLNVDVIIPTEFAKLVAKKIRAMILPPITYGYRSHPTSGGGQLFPGTTSLTGTTLIHLTLDILRETYRHGGRKFLVINGHYENQAFIGEAVELFTENAPGAKVVIACWWDQVSEKLVEEIFAGAGFPGWDTEHASITETALMQYFAPDLVRKDKILDDKASRVPKYSIYPPPEDIVPKSGVLYKATYASREKGEKLAREVSEKIAEIARRELGA
jgi:creatinine amidohydrolase